MAQTISNLDDVIDSRDVIARIEDEAERVADTADIDAETMVRVTIAGSCSGTSFALSLGRLFADDDGLAVEASAIRDALADAGVYRTGGGAADRVTIELED